MLVASILRARVRVPAAPSGPSLASSAATAFFLPPPPLLPLLLPVADLPVAPISVQ